MTRHQPLRRKSPMKRKPKPSSDLRVLNKIDNSFAAKPSPLRRSRVRPVSIAPKKVARRKEYLELREAYLADHPVCQCCKSRASRDIHHKAGRRGSLLTDTRFFAALCRHCHSNIHNYPAAARAGGWLVKPTPQP